jgi:hypothetical protein
MTIVWTTKETLVAWIGVYQHKYVNHHMVILDAKIGGISKQNLGFINDIPAIIVVFSQQA